MAWRKVCSISAIGIPKAQPRVKAYVRSGHAGVYTPNTAKGWQEAVMLATKEYRGDRLEGAIKLDIDFTLPRPKAHKKDTYVITKPDIDNLIKSTIDAITQTGLWRDDAQVCHIEAKKKYEDDTTPSGAVIAFYMWEDMK